MTLRQSDDRESDNENAYDAVVEAFSAVFGRLMGYATRDWINVEISTAQIKVVFVLRFGGTHTVNQLAERLNIGQSTASHLVEKLVQAGYVSRIDSTMDRRIIELRLTENGRILADRLSGATHKAIVAHWVSQLTDEQRTDFGHILQALLTIIENSPES